MIPEANGELSVSKCKNVSIANVTTQELDASVAVKNSKLRQMGTYSGQMGKQMNEHFAFAAIGAEDLKVEFSTFSVSGCADCVGCCYVAGGVRLCSWSDLQPTKHIISNLSVKSTDFFYQTSLYKSSLPF
ncbi:uncharacterized protein MONOS_9614 [Monocercomonoides exilis]|uniref:uncharacterized protein n=1 Tax=Monocercomonoides exilis TaxID=2049356 RepID=UPI00355A6FBF|nr:hypothetical protein MONOS_9614 [Monocercomonoides exilis]|eukprot:MONOS_9614.1-p1 / transcript=MONOS_9614.1 / gene=MONOS_9614 / organism=Monocercomonoides_exilis_PA203 / gene_product=unspecified product / transcript_product=unspecified product / location=Mono_scaffold00402:50096-51635(+) / protein_length=130 / sequence_SO=supercontig / SO=protein_coding / is_pseudo=false